MPAVLVERRTVLAETWLRGLEISDVFVCGARQVTSGSGVGV